MNTDIHVSIKFSADDKYWGILFHISFNDNRPLFPQSNILDLHPRPFAAAEASNLTI